MSQGIRSGQSSLLQLLATDSIRNAQGGIIAGKNVTAIALTGDIRNERTITQEARSGRNFSQLTSVVDKNTAEVHRSFTGATLAATAVLGIVTSGLAYWAHLRIIRHVTPVAAMSPAFLIPVFGVTWGHLFLGEALSSGIFAGGALVLLATALVTGFNPLRRWWAATPAP